MQILRGSVDEKFIKKRYNQNGTICIEKAENMTK